MAKAFSLLKKDNENKIHELIKEGLNYNNDLRLGWIYVAGIMNHKEIVRKNYWFL